MVGLTAWWLVPDMTLPAALLLGAIVAPPDAVSAAAIGRRLGLPRHVMTVLSGESLINDAASLTLFKVFLPFLAYIGAEELGGSGVLAVVAAGLWIGFNSPKTGYAARLTERPVWSAIDLLLEGVVFALIGLQMKPIAESLAASDRGVWSTVVVATIVLVVVILIRLAFIFATYYASRSQQARRKRAREQLEAGWRTRIGLSRARSALPTALVEEPASGG